MEKDKKLRPMKIWEILRRETDEDHPMGTETLRERLKESGYPCTRKTLYGDIALLNDNGYEVMRTRKISNEYYVADRSFDIPELRILMDAVQAASFITDKKTKVLIGKIAQLAGDKKAEVLQKNTVEFHTPKSDNEQIFYIVDKIGTVSLTKSYSILVSVGVLSFEHPTKLSPIIVIISVAKRNITFFIFIPPFYKSV